MVSIVPRGGSSTKGIEPPLASLRTSDERKDGNMVAGQVNLLSRSGGNQFHGSLFNNNRTENLDARNQRLTNKPGITFNQFGGSLGGPIKKDKIFFFGVYEGYRERAFTLLQETLMTPRPPVPRAWGITRSAPSRTSGCAFSTATARPHSRWTARSFSASPTPTTCSAVTFID